MDGIVVPEERLIWVPVPKVCTTSIKWALAGWPADADKPDREVHEDVEFLKIAPADSLKSDFLRFAFVRNPWDRLVSCYQDKANQAEVFRGLRRLGVWLWMSFRDFAVRVCDTRDRSADPHIRSQADLISHNGVLRVDFIGRFERFGDHWRRLRRMVPGLPPVPHRKKTNHRPYREDYTDETRKMVARRYHSDAALFNYTF